MQSNWVVRCAFVAAGVFVFAQMPPSRAGAQETISETEIEQRTKFKELTGKATPSREQVIDELSEEKFKIAYARRWGEAATEKEVDQVYAQMAARMGWTAEQLTQNLALKEIDAKTLKHRIRAEIASQRMRHRFDSKPLRGPPGDHWMPGELERFGR